MPKSKGSDVDKECPICGGIIWGKGQNVLIEGAKMIVCQSCAQYGVKVHERLPKSATKQSSYQKPRSAPKKKYVPRDNIEKVEIVSDYAFRIRNARTQNKLNQDQFAQKLNEKPSLLRRIEAGKAEPDIKLAKKIEKVYDIKLIKSVDTIDVSPQTDKYMKKSTGSSLGDIAFIKKKKDH